MFLLSIGSIANPASLYTILVFFKHAQYYRLSSCITKAYKIQQVLVTVCLHTYCAWRITRQQHPSISLGCCVMFYCKYLDASLNDTRFGTLTLLRQIAVALASSVAASARGA